MQMKPESPENAVEETEESGLTVHGIRMAGKVLVVEMCDLDRDLEAAHLHVAPLHEVEAMRSLLEMEQELRIEYGDQIWCSTAQALRFFTRANVGFCLLKPENLYIDVDSGRLLIAGWLDPSVQLDERCWILEGAGKVSPDQIYLAQLALLYHFLQSGMNLYRQLEGEDLLSRGGVVREAIGQLRINKKLKDHLLRAAQLAGEEPLSEIDTLIDGVRSSLSIPVREGVAPFLGGVWIGVSMTAALMVGLMILHYGHTVDYFSVDLLQFGRAAVKYILL